MCDKKINLMYCDLEKDLLQHTKKTIIASHGKAKC
jgi:hypothetical protein